MHILITGGAGFIGSHLCELYLKNGDRVTAIDNLSTGNIFNINHILKNPKYHFVYETIFNEPVMDRLISECDLIIHLAATVGVELVISKQIEVIENNIHGSGIIMKIANRYRKKVLIASTSEVYGKNEKSPFSESDDFLMGATSNARWSYACTKAIDEFLALAYYKEQNLPIVIIRFFNTVGPRQTGQYGMVIPRFVKQALRNEPITVYGSGNQTRCFCHVTDICNGIVNILKNSKTEGEIINLGSKHEISINNLAKKVIDITKSKSKINLIPYNKAYSDGFEDMQRRVPDIRKANKLAGFKPKMSLDKIIRDVKNYIITTGRT